ncbi:MAG: tRNA (guanosine(46)-N7)-methyltransferase TrmB [Candidatus Latescibacterota bacterium]
MATGEATDLLLDVDARLEGEPVLDWREVFGNANPVELEVGTGKGRFLIAAAQTRPQVNYVGVEWAAKYLRIAHLRSARRSLHNVRLVRADAREFLEFFVPSLSLRAIHIYFPDPWPKKKHHKRRLFNLDFLREVERALEPGGRLWLATDHQGYFDSMTETLSHACCLVGVQAEWVGARTNYEEKYLMQGKGILRRVVEKRQPAPSG